jgi:hypothetical protein
MAALNYATDYGQALEQQFPYVLHFGALYSTPNNGRYRWSNSKTIEIPSISVGGRVNANRDTISQASRNYDNAWVPKTLVNQRKWSTLVHPMDVDQTNMVTTIENITTTMNNEQKFPEMDAYTISKVYSEWLAEEFAPDIVTLTKDNVLTTFDALMQRMDERRVPTAGRILYLIPAVATLLKNASGVTRNINNGDPNIARIVTSLDQVQIVSVSPELLMTAYNFTTGWAVGASAKQISMALIHPLAVITPVSYQFSRLDEPSATSEGKYVYYEESFEDVFILANKADAIAFVAADAGAAGAISVASAAPESGGTAGDTVITVTGNNAVNTLAYKIDASAIAAPKLGEKPTGYTAFASGDKLTGKTAGHHIRVVELNKDGKVVRTGNTTLTVKA